MHGTTTHSLTHVIECEVDISPVFSLNYVLQSYEVVVSCQSLQVHDLPERSLRIGGVPESVEAFLEGQDLAIPLLDCFPDNPVCLW